MPPHGKAFYGVQLDWASDTPTDYASRLGKAPMVYASFVSFPLSTDTKSYMLDRVYEIADQGGMLLLTLEPHKGLDTVTADAVDDLGSELAEYNSSGVGVFVRFAQGMNGSSFAWGQQPSDYVSAFRRVANGVHKRAPGSAMVWSPNYGGGYPFPNERYNAKPGTADFAALDTNADGVLTSC